MAAAPRPDLLPYRSDAPSNEAVAPAPVTGGPAGFRLGYRRWLDGLRGIAILITLGAHLGLFWGGYLGVDIFFVLSGFLITTLIVEEWQSAGAVSLKRFYLRRCLRLQPALFALVAFGLVYTTWFRPDEAKEFRKEAVVAACYIANWPNIHMLPQETLGHTWSLSVEEQFYLVWPLLLYGMLRAGLTTREVMWVALGGALLSAALRLLIVSFYDPTHPAYLATIYWLYAASHTRADALLIGCAVGLFATSGLIPAGRWFRHVTGLGAVASAAGLGYMVWTLPLVSQSLYQGLFTAAAVMVAVILLRLLAAPSLVGTWVLGAAPLVAIGRLSYSLYLVHIPVLRWVPHGPLGWWALREVCLMLAAIFAAALVSYFLIERPFLRIKRRFESRPLVPQLAAEPVRPPARAAA
ncbi:acyltransferase family protein [Gemmata sp.]|uniref:acyltransferase family protein n=1 Tax=Gemmata sp. TaxID=1914242 RepID=UPI003F71820B